ncbi:hypothetical protein EVAR_3521_1 [Eumeta japonica]|uniref:Uncharacterized protein n=1 Tax=Eumeta variegata TaxID=151549 RepID=A0A4C1SXZ1_EUMVA|nr:hypothetical protein EVAR_3521_1 [Eumeta japonica]
MALNRNPGEKKEGSGRIVPAHCTIRRRFRAAEFYHSRTIFQHIHAMDDKKPVPTSASGSESNTYIARNHKYFASNKQGAYIACTSSGLNLKSPSRRHLRDGNFRDLHLDWTSEAQIFD